MHNKFLNYVYERNAPQKKKLEAFLSNPVILQELQEFFVSYRSFMNSRNISIEDLGNAYLQLIDDMCYARLEFVRHGKYPTVNQSEALTDVYNNKTVMTSYMLGLAVSQFLWRQHYALFVFYRNEVKKIKFNDEDHVLEVGCGHGLFLRELLYSTPKKIEIDAVDISETSIEITKEIIATNLEKYLNTINFVHSDVLKFAPKTKYKFITMGEVLEHVERPQDVLNLIGTFLADDGKAYISTCTNCPTLDHVYHFHTVEEIREMIRSQGFKIESEVIEPSECCSEEKLIRMKIDILYGAIISKK